MPSDKSLIIIGAGIAGLAAGIYAQKNGYAVRMFEMHDKPGGMCTSWKRGGYVFDYSIHNLAGTGKESGLRRIWDELGALDGLEVIDHPEFVRIEDYDGRSFTMFSDIDRTVAELRRLSPQDEALITEHERTARRFGRMDVFAAALGGTAMLKLLPHMRTMSRLGKETLEDRAEKFHDPLLQKAIPALQYGFTGIPMAVHYIFQSGLHHGDLGTLRGGSLALSRNLESRFKALGGTIHYRTKVDEVLVEDDVAKGVRTSDGIEHRADAVISAGDGRTTIYEMLGGRYKNELIDDYYNAGWWPKEQFMGSIVYLGVSRDLSTEPHALGLFLKEPREIDDRMVDRLDVELFSSASGLAPAGKGVIKVNLLCDFDRWKRLRDSGDAYSKAKEEVISQVIAALEPRFPGLGDQVEARDMCTLLTCERYIGVFHGLQAWGSKRDQSKIMRKGLSRRLPGLKRFYMAGQWAEGTIGLTTAAISGRRAVKSLCKDDGKGFRP